MRAGAAAAVAGLVAVACGGGPDAGSEAADELFAADIPATITVTSPAFADGDALPVRFTCDGTNISPPLHWGPVPEGTAELALVVDDPDDRDGTYVQWVVVAIPPGTPGMAEDAVPEGARETKQSDDRDRWRGPCPSEGEAAHTFRFAVYALRDGVPGSIDGDADVHEALDAIRERASAKGVLSATFAR